MRTRTRTTILGLVATASLLAAACTSGDEAATTGSDDSSGSSTTQSIPTGPAPGVTDDAIKVGITYVDLKAIGDIASLDHGDYEKAFRNMIDQINEEGGINGRKLEPVFAPINPVGTEPSEAACTKLTQDEKVFAVVGFFQADAVLCPLEAGTAVFGGQMSPERIERAKAPWYSSESSTDLQTDIITAMAEAGDLDGKVALFASAFEEEQVDEVILPLLDDLGIELTEKAVVDSGEQVDITAANAQTKVIAERFEAAGVEKVLAIGTNGLGWASGVESTDYRPQLLLTDPGSIQGYVSDKAGRDLSVLDDAVAGNLYGPAQNIWELPAMQDCIEVQEAGGVPVPEPDSLPEGAGSTYVAGTTACTVMALFQQLVDAAGEDLNYGSLAAAADGLEVNLPGVPDPLTYGPPPSADGDQPAYLFDWDPSTKTFALREES